MICEPVQMYSPSGKKRERLEPAVHYKCSKENLYEDLSEKELDDCSVVTPLSPPPLLISRITTDNFPPHRGKTRCSRCMEPILIILIACMLSVAVIVSLLMTGFLDKKVFLSSKVETRIESNTSVLQKQISELKSEVGRFKYNVKEMQKALDELAKPTATSKVFCYLRTTFGPFNIEREFTENVKVNFTDEAQMKIVKTCDKGLQVDTDLSFQILRDSSEHRSKVLYYRLDTKQMEEFKFYGEEAGYTKLKYDGKTLECLGQKISHRCNHLPLKTPVKAVVVGIDVRPREGKALDDSWFRNQYDLKGSYYQIRCPEK